MPRPLKAVSPDTLGGRIRAARQTQGLSLAEVAGTEYSTSLISQIERNKIEPSADSLKYLAEQLHLPMEELSQLAQMHRESEAETQQFQKIEEKRVLAAQLLEMKHPLRALEQLQNVEAADLRHVQIEQNQIRLVLLNPLDGLPRVGDAQVIGKAGAVEQALEETGIRDLVVDDQDASLFKIILSHRRELNLSLCEGARNVGALPLTSL